MNNNWYKNWKRHMSKVNKKIVIKTKRRINQSVENPFCKKKKLTDNYELRLSIEKLEIKTESNSKNIDILMNFWSEKRRRNQ